MQLPQGEGMWPAFWMLGDNINTGVNWPACGEIDIMEYIGRTPDLIYGSLHGNYEGQPTNEISWSTNTSSSTLSTAYHVYGVEWSPEAISYYFDDLVYETVTREEVIQAGGHWSWGQGFYILINLAVGGNWPGNPNDTTVFPQYLRTDYVRVYEKIFYGLDTELVEE